MKKVLSMMLAIAVVLSCMTAAAFAEEQNGKITAALAQKLEKLSTREKVETCIWLSYQYDAELIERMTYRECGLTAGTCYTSEEVDVYSKTYNRIAGELEAAGNQAFIEKTGVSDDDLVFCATMSPLVILNLTKEQVYAVSAYEEVQTLDYDKTDSAVDPCHDPQDAGLLFRSAFEDYCASYNSEVLYYNELYHHYTGEGALDWVLVKGYTNAECPVLLYRIVGNRLISQSYCHVPFDAAMGVYDVAEGRFYDVTDAVLGRYDGLADVYQEIGVGKLLGDLDGDNEVSVVDATMIQRCEVGLCDYPEGDNVPFSAGEKLRNYSDFNRDGDRDVIDATCIQRYLVDLPYPTGK